MHIADFPALKRLNATQIESLCNACETRVIPAGEELIRRGDAGGDLYLVLDGELQVYVPQGEREVELVRLRAPAVVGEIELLTGKSRTASVRVVADAEIMTISHDQVQARIDDGDPATLKLMFSISCMIAGRLAALTEKFVEMEATASPDRRHEMSSFRAKLFSEWSF